MNEVDPKELNKDSWNKLAELYQSKFMEIDLYDESYHTFVDELTGNTPKVLELGSGPGNISKRLLKLKSAIHLTATDIAPEMVKLTQANNPKADCLELDARNLGQLNQKFSGIVAGFVIPYLSDFDTQNFIKDCSEASSKSGILYLSFVPGSPLNSGIKENRQGLSVHFYYHQTDAIIKELESVGFELLHQISVDFPRGEETELHKILIAKKVKRSYSWF